MNRSMRSWVSLISCHKLKDRADLPLKLPSPATSDLGQAVVRQVQELLELRLDLDNQYAEERAFQPESTEPPHIHCPSRSKLTVTHSV